MRKVTTHTISKLLDSKDYNALAELANALVDEVDKLWSAIAILRRPTAVYGGSENCSADSPKDLVSTQGTLNTQTWDRETDGCAVQTAELSNFRYDKSTQKLQFARQVKVHDSCGKLVSVSAETVWVDVTTAELCE